MPEILTPADKQRLLKIARDTIISYVQTGKAEKPPLTDRDYQMELGAFVTLQKQGDLRGCIGTFQGRGPLPITIYEMAISAATQDPRFRPVKLDEMADIEIEISVLSPLREIQDVTEIEVGTHGLYITKGYHGGVLLPQVATEYGWDRETFLAHTCLKAGMPTDGWKKGAKIEIFSAEIFSEKGGGE